MNSPLKPKSEMLYFTYQHIETANFSKLIMVADTNYKSMYLAGGKNKRQRKKKHTEAR